VTVVRGGEKVNVIPSEAVLELDGRLLPGFGPEDIVAELEDLLGDLDGDVEIEVFRHDPGPSEPATGMFGLLSEILRKADPEAVPVPRLVPGVTDGRYFSPRRFGRSVHDG
jgi:acetylornithine deacetylase/succinyl-diaminopimelate desuccinylase-like protein